MLYPSSVQEYIDYGLHAWAMSRYTGLWVSMKCVTDIIESGAVVDFDPDRVQIALPTDFDAARGRPEHPLAGHRAGHGSADEQLQVVRGAGLCARQQAQQDHLGQPAAEDRHHHRRQIAISTRARRWPTWASTSRPRADIGMRLYKIGMTWPLEAEGVHEFAKGLDEILVVEEKRQILEYALKEELYNLPDGQRPRVVGKFDDTGEW